MILPVLSRSLNQLYSYALPGTPYSFQDNGVLQVNPKLSLKKDMSETQYLNCPFCENRYVMAETGKTRCPVCDAIFEIDDRVECVFADTENIRLPVNGIVWNWGLDRRLTIKDLYHK